MKKAGREAIPSDLFPPAPIHITGTALPTGPE